MPIFLKALGHLSAVIAIVLFVVLFIVALRGVDPPVNYVKCADTPVAFYLKGTVYDCEPDTHQDHTGERS